MQRTQALGFHLHQAHPLPEPEQNHTPPEPLSPLLALGALPRRNLTEAEQVDWRCGRRLSLQPGDGDAVVVCNPDGSIAGIGHREDGEVLRPKVVFDAAG